MSEAEEDTHNRTQPSNGQNPSLHRQEQEQEDTSVIRGFSSWQRPVEQQTSLHHGRPRSPRSTSSPEDPLSVVSTPLGSGYRTPENSPAVAGAISDDVRINHLELIERVRQMDQEITRNAMTRNEATRPISYDPNFGRDYDDAAGLARVESESGSVQLRARPSTSSQRSSHSFPGTLSSSSTLPVQSVASYYSGSTLYYPEGHPRANEQGEHAYVPPGQRSITTRAYFEDGQRAERPTRHALANHQQQELQQQRTGQQRRLVPSFAALRLTQPAPSTIPSYLDTQRGSRIDSATSSPFTTQQSAPQVNGLLRGPPRYAEPDRSVAARSSFVADDEYHSFMYGERRGTYSGEGGRHRDL